MVAMVQRITGETVYLNSGPMFHMATLMTTFATFAMGGTNVLTRRVDAEELCRVIEAERCNYGFVMGPTAEEIMTVNADGRYDLSIVPDLRRQPGVERHGGGGRQPVGSPPGRLRADRGDRHAHLQRPGCRDGGDQRPAVARGWRCGSSTPTGPRCPPARRARSSPAGPSSPTATTTGPELNAERFRGGWWHTGDLGRRHADGSLTFVAPLTRIVKSAAENIYPAEVEGCLVQHPAVREAAIIGVPDKRWTQRVLAVVVLQPGAEVTAAELIEHCRAQIASYKKPSVVEFADELPRQGWAVDYEELDRRYGGGGYPGSS